MTKLYLLIGLLTLLLSCSIRTQHTHHTIEELDEFIDGVFVDSELPGLSFLVIKDDSIIYDKSMGYSDIDTQKKYTKRTIQNIASVSKTIIAVAVMKAVDMGLLDLDADINSYLPFKVVNPSHPNIPITTRHLTSHSSSIMDTEYYIKSYYFMNSDAISADDLAGDYQDYYEIIKQNDLIDESLLLQKYLTAGAQWNSEETYSDQAPGTEPDYSNIGATLAAYIVERVSGLSYEDFTTTHIFEPLGMTRTGWDQSMMEHPDFATRYFSKDKKVPHYYLITKADGGLYTCTSDYSKFMKEMIKGFKKQGSLLTAASYQTMFTNQFSEDIDGEGGVFWELHTDKGAFTHDGSDPGVTTMVSYNDQKGRALIAFTNVEASKASMKYLIQIWEAIALYDWSKF